MLNTFPTWDAYTSYLRDENAREAEAELARERSRAVQCEHGRNLLQRCEPCEASINE